MRKNIEEQQKTGTQKRKQKVKKEMTAHIKVLLSEKKFPLAIGWKITYGTLTGTEKDLKYLWAT